MSIPSYSQSTALHTSEATPPLYQGWGFMSSWSNWTSSCHGKGTGWRGNVKTLYPSFLLPKEKKPGLLCINFSACWTCVTSDFLKQVWHLCVRCVSELKQFSEESVKLLFWKKKQNREGKKWLTSLVQEQGKQLFYPASQKCNISNRLGSVAQEH